jgi:NACHT domain-containing protein
MPSFRRGKWTRSRRFGWILIVVALCVPALALPVSAWFARSNDLVFNTKVGWANILAFTVGVLACLLALADRAGKLRNDSVERLSFVAKELSQRSLRDCTYLLSQLVSTDSLDGRPAQVRFSLPGPVRIKGRRKHARKGNEWDLEDVADFYLSRTRGRMVILGASGMGKTVLAARLVTDLIRLQKTRKKVGENVPLSIPLLLNISSWDPSRSSFQEWLEEQVSDQFRVAKKTTGQLISNQWIIPVLDGLDEMDSHATAPRRSQRAVECINDYIASTPNPRVVVVSRSGIRYYERLARKVRDAEEIVVQPLNREQVIDYLEERCRTNDDLSEWHPVFNSLRGENSDIVLEALGTPWRLTAAVTYFYNGGRPADLLPAQSELSSTANPHDHSPNYPDRVSRTLMETYILGKASIHRTRRLTPAKAMRFLRRIATHLDHMERQGNSGNEIILHEWWKGFSVSRIRRWHSMTTWAVMHYPFGVAGYLGLAATIPHNQGWFTGVAIFVNYVTIIFIAASRSTSRESPLTISATALRGPFRSIPFLFCLIASAGFGYLMGVFDNVPFGVCDGLAAAALTFLMFTKSPAIESEPTRPTGPLSRDRNFSFLIGSAFAAYLGLYYLDIYGLEVAIIFACMVFLGCIFASMHMRYIVCCVYAQKKGFPLAFSRFLDWACHAGLLRTSGIAYQFRHQELYDYLRISQIPMDSGAKMAR